MTEIQKYRVITDIQDMQVRLYQACVLAEITMTGEPSRVGTMAFGPLVGYISKNDIAMTSPVLQQAVPVDQAGISSQWNVSFVMPAGTDISDLPLPSDTRVSLREIPEQLAAAITWSGSWKYSEVEKRIGHLRNSIERNGYVAVGEPRWARYDPPWKPWFARRNEVIIPIAPISLEE